ncbi:MAG: TIM barrel protein [Thermoguttaceae bacterium]
MNLSRRNLLRMTAGTAAACAFGAVPATLLAAGEKKKRKTPGKNKAKIPVGLQLYSVRKQCEADLPAVLKAVAAMGYEGVEFAGYYDRTAEDLNKMLQANGLKCCGTHLRTQINTLADGKYDEFDKEVEFNKVMGNPYLVFPWMPEEMRNSLEACKKTGELLSKLADHVAKSEAYVGYHAHGGDFAKIGDTTQWDLLFGNASERVLMQMDIGNCLGGGGDPYATLEKFPGRSLTVHLKEFGGDAPVGEGQVDWKKVFRICESTGGTKWYIVEHESGTDPLASVDACLKNVRKMGK